MYSEDMDHKFLSGSWGRYIWSSGKLHGHRRFIDESRGNS